MAWYTAEYQCGHTEEMQLYGPGRERDRRLDWLAMQDCPECRARKSQEKAEVAGLPKLSGSDKQVAWGNDIRMSLVRALDAMPNAPQFDSIRDYIKSQQTAKWWIDRRGNIEEMVQKIERHQFAMAQAR